MSRSDSHLDERVAVFRHALIARLLPDDLSTDERQREIRRIVEAEHLIPGSTRTRVAQSTLRDWMRAWRSGGFDALKPRPRSDAGEPRAIEAALAERLLEIKEAESTLSIRLVIAKARSDGALADDAHLPVSTVHRLFQRHGLSRRRTVTPAEDRRRFAFAHAGELWTSDVMHGPAVFAEGRRKRKVYLIAFLDDATRVVTHAEFAFSENTRAFLPVFKRAIVRRGLPMRLYVDNGANYRSHQLAVIAAKLGVALIHARPYQPQGKGKIERYFRTIRAQLMARLTDEDLASLEALNRRLAGWVEGEYHQTPHRGLDGDTPLERWARSAEQVKYPDAHMDLDALFLFEETRKVQSDRTVSLHGRLFEIDAALVGERVTLRHDPSRPEAPVQVVHEGRVVERARLVDAYANCFVKRHRPSGNTDADETHRPAVTRLSMRNIDDDSGEDA
ncbi:MAG: DDE-type integrase/transposase/recombinase [Gammaproteobacteria bacterium]|nr:DDE-type integrase/transposase/recombinase [Gammaproteobacteria bacterium]